MVKNVLGSFTILQKEFKKRRKHKILINKELNSILIILNGISEKLNNEYMLDNIKYDEIFENMTKLNNIHNELNKILEREKRIELYKDCLKFLKTRVDLDLALFKDDIWSH